MSRNKIAIAFGGQSSEHEPTRKSFAYMLERIQTVGLRDDLELSHVLYITKDGGAVYSAYDETKVAPSYEDMESFISLTDAVKAIKDNNLFLYGILYGQNGEDGVIQGMTEFFSVNSNLGSVLSCSLSMSKYHLNRYINGNYDIVKVPLTVSLQDVEDVKAHLSCFEQREIVVKPSSLGSSVLTEKLLYSEDAVAHLSGLGSNILKLDSRILVQEYIEGAEYSCGCLEKDGEVLVLPLVRIETQGKFFGQTEKFIPGYSKESIVDEKDDTPILKKAKLFAKEIFQDLDFRNAARIDFIVKDEEIYFLEINPLPGILRGSVMTKMLRTQGLDVENLVEISFDNSQRRSKNKTEFYFQVDV